MSAQPAAPRLPLPAPAPKVRRAVLSPAVFLPVGLVLAGGLGILAATSPLMALAVLVAGATAAGALRSGTFGICALVTAFYFEATNAYTGDSYSIIKLTGGTLIAMGLASVMIRGRHEPLPVWARHPLVIAGLVGFIGIAAASAGWAVDTTQVQTLTIRLITDGLLFLAVAGFIASVRQLELLGWTVLGAAVASTAYGALLGANLFERTIGGFFDPNEYSAGMAIAVVMGVALLWPGRSWQVRAFVLAPAVVVCISGMLGSQSRGGLIALAAGSMALTLLARRGRRLRSLAPLAVAVATSVSVLLLTTGGQAILERGETDGSTGRTELFKVALYMYADEPLRGIGLGNYPVVSHQYLRADIGHTENFIGIPRIVHNTVLEILAELGTTGLLAWTVFVGGCLAVLLRALRAAERIAGPEGERLHRAGRMLGAGIATSAASALFLSGQYQELFWVLLAACLAYAAIVRRAAA